MPEGKTLHARVPGHRREGAVGVLPTGTCTAPPNLVALPLPREGMWGLLPLLPQITLPFFPERSGAQRFKKDIRSWHEWLKIEKYSCRAEARRVPGLGPCRGERTKPSSRPYSAQDRRDVQIPRGFSARPGRQRSCESDRRKSLPRWTGHRRVLLGSTMSGPESLKLNQVFPKSRRGQQGPLCYFGPA